MNYIKLKKTDSICNICKHNKKLSWDHIPPKGGIDLSDMWVQSRTQSYLTDYQPKMAVSQNGLKYKTICSDCNSELARFDLAFKDLLLDVKRIMKSELILPNPIRVNTYPVRIVKCILGHLLAAKTTDCFNVYDEKIRTYLSNDTANLPNDVRIFFWYYPYNWTIISTDVYELNLSDNSTHYYSVLKSFPLAFTVTFDNSCICNTNELIITNDSYDTKRDILFNPYVVNNWDFPEKLGDNKIHWVPIDQTNILAKPKHKRT